MTFEILMGILGFVISMITIITVILKLNTTLTKLNYSVDRLNEKLEDNINDTKDLRMIINDHEKRLNKGGL